MTSDLLRPGAYRRRVVDDELDELMAGLPAVSLEGAKGVGKTATAVARASVVHLLDQPARRELVSAAPDRLVEGPWPVLIDEWQRWPSSWDVVRRAVDADARPGRFQLTGSASPESPGTHSGAGRIVRVRMRPLSLAERGYLSSVSVSDLLHGGRAALSGHTHTSLREYAEEIVAGGFPGLRMRSGRISRAALDGYVDRIVDTDFPDMGHRVRNPAALRRWLAAYAAATSTTASFEQLRDAATSGQGDKPARTTVGPYRDVLERLWIADPVPAWLPTRNHLKRLGAAPKHHLVDPSLAARLLGVDTDALIEGRAPATPREGTLLGALFESLVAQSLRVYAQAAEGHVYHLRTHRGEHEVDYILAREDGRVVAVEVKLTTSVGDSDVKHLRWLADSIGPDLLDAVVITTGTDAYRRPDGIGVVPAALLGP
jgi:uncharacterized protein